LISGDPSTVVQYRHLVGKLVPREAVEMLWLCDIFSATGQWSNSARESFEAIAEKEANNSSTDITLINLGEVKS
jgi:hypothetical protein